MRFVCVVCFFDVLPHVWVRCVFVVLVILVLCDFACFVFLVRASCLIRAVPVVCVVRSLSRFCCIVAGAVLCCIMYIYWMCCAGGVALQVLELDVLSACLCCLRLFVLFVLFVSATPKMGAAQSMAQARNKKHNTSYCTHTTLLLTPLPTALPTHNSSSNTQQHILDFQQHTTRMSQRRRNTSPHVKKKIGGGWRRIQVTLTRLGLRSRFWSGSSLKWLGISAHAPHSVCVLCMLVCVK